MRLIIIGYRKPRGLHIIKCRGGGSSKYWIDINRLVFKDLSMTLKSYLQNKPRKKIFKMRYKTISKRVREQLKQAFYLIYEAIAKLILLVKPLI